MTDQLIGLEKAHTSATLHAHPKPDAPTCLMTDASSSSVVGAVLQQLVKEDIGCTAAELVYSTSIQSLENSSNS